MRKKYYLLLLALIAVYVALVLATPVNQAVLDKYHLTVLSLHLLNLAIIIPVIAIWCIAFYGFVTMKIYAARIKEDEDGQGFEQLGHGLAILGIGMVLSSLVSAATNIVTQRNIDLVPRGVIIGNYVAVVVALASYWYIFRGSVKLAKLAPPQAESELRRIFAVFYVIGGILFAHAAVTNPERRAPATATTHGLYYLPDPLIIMSVVVPLLVAWYIGLLGVRNILHYRREVTGVIYRTQLKQLAQGLSTIITVSVGVQILTLFSKSTADLSLNALLLIIFVLLAVIAAGFILVALGAKKLAQLEGE